MRTDMTGRVALVTGASGGIGLATARRFTEAGAAVVLSARRTELIEREAQSLTDAGHTAIALARKGAKVIGVDRNDPMVTLDGFVKADLSEQSTIDAAIKGKFQVFVDANLAHRARWIMNQVDFSDGELEFLATGKLSDEQE